MTAKLDIRMDPAQVDAALAGTKDNVSALAGEFAKLGPEAAKFAQEIAKSYQQLQKDNARLRGELAKHNDSTREQQREQQRLKKVAQEAIDAQLTPADRVRKKVEDLTAAHKAGHLSLEQYEKAVKQTQGSLTQMGDSGAQSLRSLGAELLGLLGASASIAGVADQVRKVFEEAKRMREEQAGLQMTAAVAQGEVVKMLGDPAAASQFLARSEEARGQTQFQDVDAWNAAAANVLSATAGNQELTLSLLKTIAPLQKNKPAELSALTGAVADIATLQGATSEQDVKQIFSLVIESIGQSRITSYQAFKEAAMATAASLQTDAAAQEEVTSGSADRTERTRAIREAQAAFAAVGGAIKDPEGAMTKTAVAALATQLEEFLPRTDRLNAEGEVEQAGTGLTSLAERIAAIQQSPELQRQFFEDASFERPVMPVIRSLLTNTQSEAAQRFAAASGKIGTDATTYDRTLQAFQTATPQLALQQASTSGEAIVSKFDVGATEAGRRAEISRLTSESLDRARSTEGMFTRWRMGSQQGVQDARAAAMGDAESNRFNVARLIMRREEIAGGGIRGRGLPAEVGRSLNRYVGAEDQMGAEQLRGFASIAGSREDQARLARLNEDQRRTVELLDTMVQTLLTISEQAQAQTAAGQRTADALTIAPGSRATAAAAQPSPQRLGR